VEPGPGPGPGFDGSPGLEGSPGFPGSFGFGCSCPGGEVFDESPESHANNETAISTELIVFNDNFISFSFLLSIMNDFRFLRIDHLVRKTRCAC
jgi:hypothetical protein